MDYTKNKYYGIWEMEGSATRIRVINFSSRLKFIIIPKSQALSYFYRSIPSVKAQKSEMISFLFTFIYNIIF